MKVNSYKMNEFARLARRRERLLFPFHEGNINLEFPREKTMINGKIFNACANKAIMMKRNIILRIKYLPFKREKILKFLRDLFCFLI